MEVEIEDYVYRECPQCKEEVQVQANMINLDYAQSPVSIQSGHAYVAWEELDISGDFEYVCSECGYVFGYDLTDFDEKNR